jgi:hypothetical protein
MRIDNIFQFIVPLTFLAIWALTSLFNRDAQPLPPRTARLPEPNGPQPPSGTAVSRGYQERRQEGSEGNRTVTRVTTNPRPVRSPSPRGYNGVGDDIIVIDGEPRRPVAPTSIRPSPPMARRGSKTRPSAQPTAPKPEPATARALSGSMSLGASSHLDHQPGLKPLSLPQSSPLLPSNQTAERGASQPHQGTPPTSALTAVRTLISSRERLRESYLASEVLFSRPLSLRNGPLPLRGKRRPPESERRSDRQNAST